MFPMTTHRVHFCPFHPTCLCPWHSPLSPLGLSIAWTPGTPSQFLHSLHPPTCLLITVTQAPHPARVREVRGRVAKGHKRKQENGYVQCNGCGDGFVTECIWQSVNCTFLICVVYLVSITLFKEWC